MTYITLVNNVIRILKRKHSKKPMVLVVGNARFEQEFVKRLAERIAKEVKTI